MKKRKRKRPKHKKSKDQQDKKNDLKRGWHNLKLNNNRMKCYYNSRSNRNGKDKIRKKLNNNWNSSKLQDLIMKKKKNYSLNKISNKMR